jgi:L-arabinose isomerase
MSTHETDNDDAVRSFEVAEGEVFGDLLSADHIETGRRLKVGLLSTGFFEFWPMYPAMKAQVERDARVVADRLARGHDIVDSGLVDTLDKADVAGRWFRAEQIDVLILAYRTYIPDAYVHQLLSHLPGMPLLLFASQSRGTFDPTDDYSGVLRNSGLMALVQLVCGFRKMQDGPRQIESVAGSIHDDEAYRKIDRYLDVLTIYTRLKTMTFGVIGHVFRGMFDFEYDKTSVKGALGPEILNVQIEHLTAAWTQAAADDLDVRALVAHARSAYRIDRVGDDDLVNASRAAVALRRLVGRFRLDGIALLCQHFIEKQLKTSPYLGLAELHRAGFPGVTEGDVVGLIMMKILHHLTGNMPFFLEWSEFDVERNAWMLLGHGFGDPSQARQGAVQLTPASERWGLEGTGCNTLFVPSPGPCTLGHFVQHAGGWRMFVAGGEILDLDPLPINDVHAVVRIDAPIREFTERLVKAGVPHHAITVRGDVRRELAQLAELMGMPVVSP